MKLIRFIFVFLFALESLILISADIQTVKIAAQSDGDIEIRDLEIEVQLFTNRTNLPITSVPNEFEGFKFLSHGGGVDLIGTIKATENGEIYIAVRSNQNVDGWTKVENGNFTYATTEMSIYYKDVLKDETIDIPTNTDFRRVTPIAKEIILEEIEVSLELDSMEIIVETDDNFEKRILTDGVKYFLNRDYITYDVNEKLKGFEFLSSDGGVSGDGIANSGIIIPKTDGYVYVLGRSSTAIPGWELVGNSKFYYNTPTPGEISLFRKSALADERIEIPIVDNFQEAKPIAWKIELRNKIDSLKDAYVNVLFVDNEVYKKFHKDTLNYHIYLPYTATQVPEIRTESFVGSSVISNAQNILSESEADRTTKITVTSEDETNVNEYNIVFEVLPKLDLFLCLGQSNMAGAAPLDKSKGDFDIINDAFLFNSDNHFESAQNGMNRYANILSTTNQYLGPSFSFAKKITNKIENEIGLIVNARGGSAIEQWMKDGTNEADTLYAKTMERALEAKKWGEYKAVLWHQGEANRNLVATYPDKLNNFVTSLRNDLESPELLFVAGEIGQWREDFQDFNEMIRTINSFVDNAAYVSSDGLTERDLSHFDRESQILLGERYADIILQNLYPPIFSGIGKWSNAERWTKVPTSTNDVIISGAVTVDEDATINNISIKSGATLTIDDEYNLTVNGEASVKQEVTTKRTYYMGSPVNPLTAVSGIENIATFDIANDTWSALTNNPTASDIPVTGPGFLAQVQVGTVSFTGPLNNGDVQVDLSNSGKKFNFLANPYPSYLKSDEVLQDANIESTIWQRTKGATGFTFVTYNHPTGGPATTIPSDYNGSLIAPMQGFWVKAKDTAAETLTFTNAMRSHNIDNQGAFKAPQQSISQQLILTISNGVSSDEAMVRFNEQARIGITDWDARKMMNDLEALNIYTTDEGVNLAINSYPSITEGVEIPVGLNIKAGNYTLSAKNFRNFVEGTKVNIMDKESGVVTDLATSSYEFTLTERLNNSTRFALVIPKSDVGTGIETLSDNNVFAFARNGHIVVNTDASEGTIYVFNGMGQHVATQALKGQVTEIQNALPAGVYVVKLNNKTTKVVVK